jgi:hypothetical protein
VLKQSQYSIKTETVYLPFDPQVNSLLFKPCNAEKNVVKYTLSIPNFSFVADNVIVVNAIIRRVLGAVRLNSSGDLFLDGRNVIVRSKEGNSSLALKEDGNAKMQGITTEIGSTLSGKLLLNKAGIVKEVGNFSAATETLRNTETTATKSSPKLFYVDDAFPMIKAYFVSAEEASADEPSGWVLSGVTKDEYSLLTIEERSSVEKTYVTQVEDSTQITESFLLKLIQEGYPSYGALKAGI